MAQTILQAELQKLPESVQQDVSDLLIKANKKLLATKGLKKRTFGYGKGRVKISEDFNAPLDVFKAFE